MSMKTAQPDQYLRRRLSDHTGLADGRNSALAELRKLTSEYPADRVPSLAATE